MHLRPAQLYQGFCYLHFHRVSPAASSLNTMMSDSKSKQCQKTFLILFSVQIRATFSKSYVIGGRWVETTPLPPEVLFLFLISVITIKYGFE